MYGVDFHILRREIKEAARRAFSLVREHRPGETFYAFALYSDSDGGSACPAANTEEAFHRCLKKYEPYRKETEAVLATSGMTYADYKNYYRWGVCEWEYCPCCPTCADQFSQAWDLINATDNYDRDDPSGFVSFKAKVYGSMMLGLRDLEVEGFFEAGSRRESVILLCDILGDRDGLWLAMKSAQLLNPPHLLERFWPQWMAWQDRENQEFIGNPSSSSVYRLFKAFFKSEGGL
jgi:hypothetical protein